MFWIGFNQHTASSITKEVGEDREGNTTVKPWWGGRRTIWILPNMLCLVSIVIPPWIYQSPTQKNSAWAAPKNREVLPFRVSAENTPLPSQSTSLFRVSGEAPVHPSKPNSIISSPRKPSLSNLRESKSHSSQQYLWTLYSNSSGTKHTTVDHLPRAKHCSKGTTDIAKVGKELTVYKCINT